MKQVPGGAGVRFSASRYRGDSVIRNRFWAYRGYTGTQSVPVHRVPVYIRRGEQVSRSLLSAATG